MKCIIVATAFLSSAMALVGCSHENVAPPNAAPSIAPASQPAGVPPNWLKDNAKFGFFGMDGSAGHVVYVIDRSGSMLPTFDFMREGLKESINGLKGTQDFHLIFFSIGSPMEMPAKMLTPASEPSKKAAGEFLDTIVPEGQTDPLPAIKRAIDVLNKAQSGMHNKVIVLLTDGAFPDNDKVFMLIKQLDPKKEIRFFTVLFDDKEPDAEKVLKKIADDSGGQFKQVPVDD